jgi:tRNA modification GTPase
MNTSPVQLTVLTAPNPGAVGMVQLTGPGARDLLTRLTGQTDWPAQRMRLVDFAGIDHGMAVLLRDDWAQLMPHGGPRVMRRLVDHLLQAGAAYASDPSPRDVYPEAADDVEAHMLAAIARAASPAAIDLLLAQPNLWREPCDEDDAAIAERSARWNRLIDPPSVVVVGAPNVGKSTLTNLMLGRAASVVADLPGTTRDWVAGLAEIRGIAVRWMDTPGLRRSGDMIEQQAIELASQVIEQADVLIAMRDRDHDWPDESQLPRRADLHVVNKCDGGAGEHGDTLRISVLHSEGIGPLEQCVIALLGLGDIDVPRRWAFCDLLR